jgi:hypothetical protein
MFSRVEVVAAEEEEEGAAAAVAAEHVRWAAAGVR